MTGVVRVHEAGGPEVMRFEDAEVGSPGRGQALLRQTAIGLNYIDVYFRSGVYPAPQLPFTPGLEGAGVVEAVGEGVSEVREGQRVAYASPPIGAYAARRLMAADRLVALPDGISDEQAAAMMLKGMTAHYLLRRTYRVESGQTILFHAAAGGVGLIAGQWAKHLGATVIGTVGSEAKAELARANGYAHVIRYDREDIVARVREITGGKGVPVVLR
jgi:NADPH2:quinone reductase